MTKTQLIEKIQNIDRRRYTFDETLGTSKYGGDSFLGEYALSDNKEWDIIVEDFNWLNLKYFDEVKAETYNSKSGIGFWLEGFKDPQITDEIRYLQESVDEGRTIKYLKKTYSDIIALIKEYKKKKDEIYNEIKKAQRWVESFALGKRLGSFSNREVCFKPLGRAKKAGWKHIFTPYYNPNI